MTSKRILINIDVEESRAAIVEDGRLVNLEIQGAFDSRVRGNVYSAIVRRVEPSLQAAFVDYGVRKEGFLPASELRSIYFPDGNRRLSLEKALKPGKQLLVQVVKDAVGSKGASLTTYISIPGRFLVLMPDSQRSGVSRKLSDTERKRLKQLLEEVSPPEGLAVIARTASMARTKQELQKDLTYLTRLWNGIQAKSADVTGAALIYQEQNLALRFLRDYFTADIDEIWVDDPAIFQDIRDFLTVLMPRQVDRVRLHADATPLFVKFDVENQINDVFSRRVRLPAGGSIVIDQTEALVAIDVNSGRVKQKDIEETALLTNIEAAREIARQAVLRDLGGLLVLDFIDMRDRSYRRKVETALKQAFRDDKARIKFGHISEFGLLELSRQRIRSDLLSGSFRNCPHCEGTGLMRTEESTAQGILRQIKETLSGATAAYVKVEVAPSQAHYLLNARRRELALLERSNQTRIEVIANSAIFSNAVRVVADRLGPPPEIEPTLPTIEFTGPPEETSVASIEPLTLYDRSMRESIEMETPEESLDPASLSVPSSIEPEPEPVVDDDLPLLVPGDPQPDDAARFARSIRSHEALGPSSEESERPGMLTGWLRRLFGVNAPVSQPSFRSHGEPVARSVIDPLADWPLPSEQPSISLPPEGGSGGEIELEPTELSGDKPPMTDAAGMSGMPDGRPAPARRRRRRRSPRSAQGSGAKGTAPESPNREAASADRPVKSSYLAVDREPIREMTRPVLPESHQSDGRPARRRPRRGRTRRPAGPRPKDSSPNGSDTGNSASRPTQREIPPD